MNPWFNLKYRTIFIIVPKIIILTKRNSKLKSYLKTCILKCKHERKVVQKIFTLSNSSQCLFWEKINVFKILYFELWYIHCSLVALRVIVKFIWEIALMYINTFFVLFLYFLIWWHLILIFQMKSFVNILLLVFKYIFVSYSSVSA